MATKIVNSLAGLPAEVTVKKLVKRSNYDELWISFPESERICPHCSSQNCIIKDFGKDSSAKITADALIFTPLFVPNVTNSQSGRPEIASANFCSPRRIRSSSRLRMLIAKQSCIDAKYDQKAPVVKKSSINC